MEIRPILSALLRNKTGAILVALQIAITLAVVTNALFIINQRLEKIGRPAGMDTQNMLFVKSYGYSPDYNHAVAIREDLELIRATPGVIAATAINGIPMSGGGSSNGIKIEPSESSPDVTANYYEVDEQGLDALGIKLVTGRAFSRDIIKMQERHSSYSPPEIIVTRDMAKALFDTEDVVGRRVYDGLGQSTTIVGVTENMLGAWVGWDKLTQVIFLPIVPAADLWFVYLVRTAPGERDRLIAELEQKLTESNRTRVISWVRPHDYYIERSYKSDTRMAVLLGVTILLLVSMTVLGIIGLASFSVNARVKQIGTRRAVGARKLDILRYFMLENWLLTTMGVLAGCVLAYLFSYWLSTEYSLPRLGTAYVVGGVLCMWMLGQLAVLVPARRAALVPPAVATRTV